MGVDEKAMRSKCPNVPEPGHRNARNHLCELSQDG